MSMSSEAETLKRLQEAEYILRKALNPFVARHMEARFGSGWRLYASRAKGSDPKGELDLYGLLLTVIQNWTEVFGKHLPVEARSFIYIARDGRNATAHAATPIDGRNALRHLDAHLELLRILKAGTEAAKVQALYDAQRSAGVPPAPAAETAALPDEAHDAGETPALPPGLAEPRHHSSLQRMLGLDGPLERLVPWRTVAFPRIDVLENRFLDAEFAADLAAVDRGVAPEEYGKAHAFFQMTLPTTGLVRVLRSAYERLTSTGGDPVIGLQTAFGGGKTHSLLALYHMASLETPGDVFALREVVRGAAGTWRPARVAAFVGTAFGPDVPFETEGGRTIRTLWGYLAWRLLGDEGLAEVASAEAAGTSPGSVALERVLRAAAPCLILLDEVVAYVRQLGEARFESHLTFFQELTEAVKLVPGAVVVASLPESATEAGGAKGQEALRRLEKIFGRIQSPWLPASGQETLIIVTHRLFSALDPRSEKTRDQTVKAFHDLYRKHRGEFPPHVAESGYLEEMRLCYPFHPELLSRLAKDWAGLEKFQRTRGVLKLLAQVVATLWDEERDDPLILPAHVPLRNQRVRAALLNPIDPGYGAVIEREVEGVNALPALMEANPTRNITRARAATRVARALFVCSVPSASQANKGISGPDIRLACVMPGDQIDVFGNALREFAERAVYLYEEAGRYWLAPQPTLNKLADDRARALSPEEVDADIVRMLREEGKTRGGFARVHAALDDPTDADDTMELGLVILGPVHAHAGRAAEDGPATRAVADALLRRGGAQRKYRNTLVFLAADVGSLEQVRAATRKALAWESILKDAEAGLELTASQRRDAADKVRSGRQGALDALRAAWSHGLYPVKTADGTPDPKPLVTPRPFVIEHVAVSGRIGNRPIPVAAFEKFEKDGIVTKALGPESFWHRLKDLWPADAPHLAVTEVATWFASYVYLDRLRDRVVLSGAIEAAVARTDPPFALARLKEDGSGYRDISLRRTVAVSFDSNLVLLRREEAERLLAAPAPAAASFGSRQVATLATDSTVLAGRLEPQPAGAPAVTVDTQKTLTRFYGSLDLDPNRPVAKLGSVVDGVLSELARPGGARVRLVLEIHAEAPGGFPEDVVAVVRDNMKTLGFDDAASGFAEN